MSSEFHTPSPTSVLIPTFLEVLNSKLTSIGSPRWFRNSCAVRFRDVAACPISEWSQDSTLTPTYQVLNCWVLCTNCTEMLEFRDSVLIPTSSTGSNISLVLSTACSKFVVQAFMHYCIQARNQPSYSPLFLFHNFQNAPKSYTQTYALNYFSVNPFPEH